MMRGMCIAFLWTMDNMDMVLIDEKILNQLKTFLINHSETVAVAESVTVGILQTALASVKDASCFFHGGITAYNLGQKARHLQINPIHAATCNCVSERIAKDMALNVCGLFSSDWGIAITGYATVEPAVKMRQPFAYYAIAYKNSIQDAGCLKHKEDLPPLIQYYYVNEILKRFAKATKKLQSQK